MDNFCLDDSGDCPEHGKFYGKFQSCRDETVFYNETVDSDPEEEFGDIDYGYYALVDLGEHYPPYTYAIVDCLTSGAVYVHYFDTYSDAIGVWKSEYGKSMREWERMECEECEGEYGYGDYVDCGHHE